MYESIYLNLSSIAVLFYTRENRLWLGSRTDSKLGKGLEDSRGPTQRAQICEWLFLLHASNMKIMKIKQIKRPDLT